MSEVSAATPARNDVIAHLYQSSPQGHGWGGSQGHISLPRLLELHTEEHRDGRVGHEAHDLQPYPAVRVGQVWADNDPRSAGRTLRVMEVMRGGRGCDTQDRPYAVCVILTNSDHVQERVNRKVHTALRYEDRCGATVRIRLDRLAPTSTGYRLAPTSTGYRLVSEPPGETAG